MSKQKSKAEGAALLYVFQHDSAGSQTGYEECFLAGVAWTIEQMRRMEDDMDTEYGSITPRGVRLADLEKLVEEK